MAINNSTRARQSRRPGYMYSESLRALVAAQMVERNGYSVPHASGATCVSPTYVRAVLHADSEVRRQLGAGKLRLVDVWQGYCGKRRRHAAGEARAEAEARAKARAETEARERAEAEARAQAEADAKKLEAEVDHVLDTVGFLPVVARIISRFGADSFLDAADTVLRPRGRDLIEIVFNTFGPERVNPVLDKLTAPHQSSTE